MRAATARGDGGSWRRPGWCGHAAAGLLLLALGCGGGGGGTATSSASATPPFTVSGQIQIAFGSAEDSDVNDPDAPFTANDTRGTAQEVPNPVTLGGYLNKPGAGPFGRSHVIGDLFDYFHVSLAGGQTVRLFMAGNGTTDDLDLALLDSGGNEVASSDTNTPTESVVAPTSGEFFIEVSVFAGASNYVLTIGQTSTAAAAAPPEFVPGQVIVRMRNPVSPASASARSIAAAAPLGLETMASTPGGPTLLAAHDARGLEDALRAAGVEPLPEPDAAKSLSPSAQGVARGATQDEARMKRNTRRLAKALRARPDVLSADLDYVRRASAVPTDEFYPLQWHYPMIRLPEAWDLIAPNSGVIVAVIDTGVVDEHPDLAGQLVPGYDFIQDPARARDGNGCDADPSDPGDSPTPGASSFHGTHVTGTLVAATSLEPGGNSVGVAGVAWNAKVMPLRALGLDGGTDADLIAAIRYAAGLPNACGVLPATHADVINMSLGGAGESVALDQAITDARAAGVVVVAAAGNSASSQPQFPAASPGVISVSAVDAQEQLAYYSNFGNTVDIAAPGGDLTVDRTLDGYGDGVLSTLFDDETGDFVYAFYQGTSMATPHVAGVIALMLGVNPALTPTDIDNLLSSGAMTRDIGSSFLFGHGLVDAFAAVSAAITAEGGAVPTAPPQLSADPGALNFGATSTQATLTLSNSGGPTPPLQVTSVETLEDDGGSWLSEVATSVNAAGLGTYTIHVNRTALADGIYTGVVRFHSNAGDLDVAVIMQVGTEVAADANAGLHYVLLVDPDTFVTAAEVPATASNGHYTFTLPNVDPGSYLLYAGTDSDNDSLICDRGEACGAYPSLDQPRPIAIDKDKNGVTFLTGFGLRLGAEGGDGRVDDPDAGGFSRTPGHGRGKP